MYVLWCGRTPDHPEETHVNTGRTPLGSFELVLPVISPRSQASSCHDGEHLEKGALNVRIMAREEGMSEGVICISVCLDIVWSDDSSKNAHNSHRKLRFGSRRDQS